jgi:hypothetical protein
VHRECRPLSFANQSQSNIPHGLMNRVAPRDFDDENIMKKLRTPLTDDYVVELICEHGDCDRIIGWGSDLDAAHQCYEATVRKYPHTTVRLRKGMQLIALRMRSSFVLLSHKH